MSPRGASAPHARLRRVESGETGLRAQGFFSTNYIALQYSLRGGLKPTDPIQSIQRAAHRHTFRDGITEILVGILLAAGALTILRKPVIVILAIALTLKWTLPRLRSRFVTPRVGSAVLPERPGRTIVGVFIYGILAGAAVFMARLATAGSGAPLGAYRWLPLFVGLFLSGGFLYVAGKTRLRRFLLCLAASIGAGLVLALTIRTGARQEAYASLVTLLWGLSALLLLTGAGTLIRFIRRNPVVMVEDHGGGCGEQ